MSPQSGFMKGRILTSVNSAVRGSSSAATITRATSLGYRASRDRGRLELARAPSDQPDTGPPAGDG